MAANGSPSEGSIIGKVAPETEATQRLSMKCAAAVATDGHAGCGAFIAV
jgi:hypothetical protein